jgi:hypothetical protein
VAATFTVGATAVTFRALIDQFDDSGDPPFRQMAVRVFLASYADWEAFASLRSRVSVRAAAGGTGSAVYDVGNGPGLGGLVIGALGSGTAYLTSLSVEREIPRHRRIGRAAFQIVTWTPVTG